MKKFKVIVEWRSPEKEDPICIYEAEGSNPFLMIQLWERIRQEFIPKIAEGDQLKFSQIITLTDPVVNETISYWEITIPSPISKKPEDYALIIAHIKKILDELKIPFEYDSPDDQEKLTNKILELFKEEN